MAKKINTSLWVDEKMDKDAEHVARKIERKWGKVNKSEVYRRSFKLGLPLLKKEMGV